LAIRVLSSNQCESYLQLASDLVWQNKHASASIYQTGKMIITASHYVHIHF